MKIIPLQRRQQIQLEYFLSQKHVIESAGLL